MCAPLLYLSLDCCWPGHVSGWDSLSGLLSVKIGCDHSTQVAVLGLTSMEWDSPQWALMLAETTLLVCHCEHNQVVFCCSSSCVCCFWGLLGGVPMYNKVSCCL